MALRRWFLLSSVLLGAALVDACSSSDDAASSPGGCFGVYCNNDSGSDAAPDHTLEVGTLDQQLPGDGSSYNPLCGQGCDPDDLRACSDSAAPSPAGPDAVEDAGLDAASADASDASRPEAGPSDSGVRRDVEATSYGCQVRRNGSGRAAICGPAGSGAENAPCISSADCAPGLACIGDAKAALCRRYCCNGSEGSDGSDRDSAASPCADGNYCAVRSLRDDADSADPLQVPVCVPAEKCLLSEPYPCPPNGMCTCPEGTACTVVRNDGTTGCVAPGTGVQGEACPCAAGHWCSVGTDRCLKLCLTTAPPSASSCGSGGCQSVTGFPRDWGVCVGSMDAGPNRF